MISRVALQEENDRLHTLVDHKDHRIRQLEELIQALRHRQFGSSSEQTPPEQARLFDELEASTEPLDDAPVRDCGRRRHNGRPRLSEDLPRVEVIHDLTDDQKVCAEHGCALTAIGEETSEQIEFIPATVRVIRNICRKYTCPQCDGHVVTANKPPQPNPKSMATASLLAWIVVSKYVDALPLYRQCEIFKRIGFEADRTTLANWMIACGRLIQPLINLLQDELRRQPYLHMDETTVQVMVARRGRRASHRSWRKALVPPIISPTMRAPTRLRKSPRAMWCAAGPAMTVSALPPSTLLT